MNLVILSPEQAALLEAAPTLEPRRVDAGPEAGNYAVSTRTLTDPVQTAWWPVLSQGRVIDLDIDAAWPD